MAWMWWLSRGAVNPICQGFREGKGNSNNMQIQGIVLLIVSLQSFYDFIVFLELITWQIANFRDGAVNRVVYSHCLESFKISSLLEEADVLKDQSHLQVTESLSWAFSLKKRCFISVLPVARIGIFSWVFSWELPGPWKTKLKIGSDVSWYAGDKRHNPFKELTPEKWCAEETHMVLEVCIFFPALSSILQVTWKKLFQVSLLQIPYI